MRDYAQEEGSSGRGSKAIIIQDALQDAKVERVGRGQKKYKRRAKKLG